MITITKETIDDMVFEIAYVGPIKNLDLDLLAKKIKQSEKVKEVVDKNDTSRV